MSLINLYNSLNQNLNEMQETMDILNNDHRPHLNQHPEHKSIDSIIFQNCVHSEHMQYEMDKLNTPIEQEYIDTVVTGTFELNPHHISESESLTVNDIASTIHKVNDLIAMVGLKLNVEEIKSTVFPDPAAVNVTFEVSK